jgi:hypothetical protein
MRPSERAFVRPPEKSIPKMLGGGAFVTDAEYVD